MLLVAQHMVQFELLGIEPPPMSDREFSWPVYDIFETADGRPMFVGAVTEGQWDMLCGILGLEKFLADPGLRTRVDQIADRERTPPEFHRAIASRRFGELQSAFEKTEFHSLRWQLRPRCTTTRRQTRAGCRFRNCRTEAQCAHRVCRSRLMQRAPVSPRTCQPRAPTRATCWRRWDIRRTSSGTPPG